MGDDDGGLMEGIFKKMGDMGCGLKNALRGRKKICFYPHVVKDGKEGVLDCAKSKIYNRRGLA